MVFYTVALRCIPTGYSPLVSRLYCYSYDLLGVIDRTEHKRYTRLLYLEDHGNG